MKKIRSYLQEYYTTTFNPVYLFVLMAFLAVLVYINYGLGLTRKYIYAYTYQDIQFVWFFGLYAVAFGGAYLLFAATGKRWDIFRSGRFWLLFFLGVTVFALRVSFFRHKDLIEELFPDRLYHWAVKTFDNLAELVLVLSPLAIYWYLADRKKEPYYGFTLKNYDTRPYLVMLLLMVPLIALASFQGDFLNTYPTSGRINNLEIHTNEGKLLYAVYELFYGADFISIEFFFRGFLVFTFGRILGPHAILPMCSFYVVIHFGKPLGETISSFFGGWLLGIISYYSRSIAGGIIVHVGIAWLMELGALLKKLYG